MIDARILAVLKLHLKPQRNAGRASCILRTCVKAALVHACSAGGREYIPYNLCFTGSAGLISYHRGLFLRCLTPIGKEMRRKMCVKCTTWTFLNVV